MTDSTSATNYFQSWQSLFQAHYQRTQDTASASLSGDTSMILTTSDTAFSGRVLRRGSQLYLAWGDLGGATFDSLWSNLMSLDASATSVAGRVAGTRTMPRLRLPNLAAHLGRWRHRRLTASVATTAGIKVGKAH